MVYHEIAVHDYFISCLRKYSDEHNQCDIRAMGRLDVIPSDTQWLSCVLIGCNLNCMV